MNDEQNHIPRAGDTVRLALPWKWASELPVNSIGIINGMVNEDMTYKTGSLTFRASAFRNDSVVSCSGGPATIGGVATENLRWTGETIERTFWRWKDNFPGAGRGYNYTLTVPVWEWNGEQEASYSMQSPDLLRLVRIAHEIFKSQADPEHFAHNAINWERIAADFGREWRLCEQIISNARQSFASDLAYARYRHERDNGLSQDGDDIGIEHL